MLYLCDSVLDFRAIMLTAIILWAVYVFVKETCPTEAYKILILDSAPVGDPYLAI